VLPECALCGELNPSALIKRAGGFVCANCEARERGRPGARCARCGLTAPFERHHVEGRRNSPRTAPLCLNCHRIAHAADMRRTLRGAGASIAGAGKATGGQRATVLGGYGRKLDMGAGGAAGGLDAMVRGDMAQCSTLGAGEATGGQGAMVRGGDGPMLDRSHRAGGKGLGWSRREVRGHD
jgi:hypothetical protein